MSRAATLNDLLKEKWLREREQDEIKWTTKKGAEIPIKDLTDEHLANIIKHLVEREEYMDIACDYAAYIDSSDLG